MQLAVRTLLSGRRGSVTRASRRRSETDQPFLLLLLLLLLSLSFLSLSLRPEVKLPPRWLRQPLPLTPRSRRPRRRRPLGRAVRLPLLSVRSVWLLIRERQLGVMCLRMTVVRYRRLEGLGGVGGRGRLGEGGVRVRPRLRLVMELQLRRRLRERLLDVGLRMRLGWWRVRTVD